MSFEANAQRVRDPSQPLGQRVTALHHCIEKHAPFGFEATRQELRRRVGAQGFRMDVRRGYRTDLWTEDQVVAAVELLDESRRSWLAYRRAFAARRREEKAMGWRQPTKDDLAGLEKHEWLKDPAEAAARRKRSPRRGG